MKSRLRLRPLPDGYRLGTSATKPGAMALLAIASLPAFTAAVLLPHELLLLRILAVVIGALELSVAAWSAYHYRTAGMSFTPEGIILHRPFHRDSLLAWHQVAEWGFFRQEIYTIRGAFIRTGMLFFSPVDQRLMCIPTTGPTGAERRAMITCQLHREALSELRHSPLWDYIETHINVPRHARGERSLTPRLPDDGR